MDTIRTSDGSPLRWDDGALIHGIEGALICQGSLTLWTRCRHNVPAGSEIRDSVEVTCPYCLAGATDVLIDVSGVR